MNQPEASSRQAIYVTLALACVVGVVAGAAAFLLAQPADTSDSPGVVPDHPVATGTTDVATAQPGNGPLVKAPAAVTKLVVRARKGGRTEREQLAHLLASPDPDVHFTTALELMLQGPAVLTTLKALDPATDAARQLVGKMITSLEHLGAVQTTKVWPTLWDDKRLELQMQAFEKVIPEDYLTEQAEEFYAAKAASDRKRFDMGHIEEGELFLTEALLAGERVRQGKLAGSELAGLLEARGGTIRTWLKDVKQSNRFAGRRWQLLHDRFEALQRL
jgi:hypothetical protein